jgi:hypothetical protein
MALRDDVAKLCGLAGEFGYRLERAPIRDCWFLVNEETGAAAMREEYMTDPKGRRVRLLHPAPLLTDGTREMMWDDIRTAPREHMQVSFQHRRQGVVGDCRQMRTDVDSYNDAHADAEPILVVFDFTMDLAELEAADEAA